MTKITGVSSSWQVAFARAAQRCNAAVPTVNKMCCKYVILLIIYIGNNYSPETQAAVCEDRRHKSVTGWILGNINKLFSHLLRLCLLGWSPNSGFTSPTRSFPWSVHIWNEMYIIVTWSELATGVKTYKDTQGTSCMSLFFFILYIWTLQTFVPALK